MNPAIWVGIFLPLFVILMQRRKRKNMWAAKRQALMKKKGKLHMEELAKRLIGKECIVYLMDNQVTGVLREVNDGAILLHNGKDTDVVNLSFVMRIREYPVDKNGKRKSIVLD